MLPHNNLLRAALRVTVHDHPFDDARNLLSAGGAAPALPPAVAASATAPLLLALDAESELTALLGHGAAGVATLERLGPLGAEASLQMARHLARIHGLQLDDAAVAALEREAAGSPFYLAAIVRALVERDGTGPADVACAAAAAVCDAELARYCFDRLAAHLTERSLRATAIEVLAYCLREEGEPPETGRLAALMLKSEAEVEAALEALRRAGVVRIDCARVVVGADPVLREAVLALYRCEFERASPAVIVAACAAAKVLGPQDLPSQRRVRGPGCRHGCDACRLYDP